MTGVVPHRRRSEVGGRSFGSGIAGRDLSDSSWDGEVLEFESLGISTPEALGVKVSSGVTDDPRVHRKPQYHRKRLAWQPGRGGILIADYRQRVEPRPDGKFRTTAGYLLDSALVYLNASPPQRRVGDVADDRKTEGTPEQGEPAGARAHPAHQALAFLPESVRDSFMRRVAHPTHFGAEAIRWNHGARHSVSALRMDGHNAVIVEASQQQGAAVWQVEQVEYVLRSPVPAIGYTS